MFGRGSAPASASSRLLPAAFSRRLRDCRAEFAAERGGLTSAQRMEARLPELLALTGEHSYDQSATKGDGNGVEHVWNVVLWSIDCVVQALEETIANRQASSDLQGSGRDHAAAPRRTKNRRDRELVSVKFQLAVHSVIFTATARFEAFKPEHVRAAYALIVEDFLATTVVPRVRTSSLACSGRAFASPAHNAQNEMLEAEWLRWSVGFTTRVCRCSPKLTRRYGCGR
jgi:hypothetical protein